MSIEISSKPESAISNLATAGEQDRLWAQNQPTGRIESTAPTTNDNKFLVRCVIEGAELTEKQTAAQKTAVKEVHENLSKPIEEKGFDKHKQADAVADAMQKALKAGVPLDQLIKALNKDLAEDKKLSPEGKAVFQQPKKADDGKYYMNVTPGGVGGFELNATQSEKGEWTVKYDGVRLRNVP